MKHTIVLSLTAMLWTSCLFGQARTDAEERYKMKTGRLHPEAERRLEDAKKAAERKRSMEANEHRDAAGDSRSCSCACRRSSNERAMRNSS
ncbi:MAG: hypothetical protein JWO48_771 [Bryobacterales bacterium]|jgi:hypothetical protein|nr:hypothetical protein [Bryobacterales bacterium]